MSQSGSAKQHRTKKSEAPPPEKPTAEDAQRYLATEKLLRETMEYLNRLPKHPLTTEMAQKIADHLNDPLLALTRQRAQFAKECDERDLHEQLAVFGFLRSGEPVIRASLVGHILTLNSPGLASEVEEEAYLQRAQERMLDLLKYDGITMKLSKRLNLP